jgi:hypothetical protein
MANLKQKRQLMAAGAVVCAVSIGAGLWNTPAVQAQGVRIEAEAKPSAGDLTIVEDKGASGGKAVSISRDWQPLMHFDVPASGDEWTLWMHHKGGPLQAKSLSTVGRKSCSGCGTNQPIGSGHASGAGRKSTWARPC